MAQISGLGDTLENRLVEFSQQFSKYFLRSLREVHDVAIKESKAKVGTGTQLIGKSVGAALGAGVGVITGLFGALAGIKLGTQLGGMVAGKFGEKEGRKKAEKVNKLLGDQINGREMTSKFKQFLVSAAFDIFYRFEYQMAKMTSDGGWSQAINAVAKEAVQNIVGSLQKMSLESDNISTEAIFRALMDSKANIFSKGESFTNKDTGIKWHCGYLFQKPGIIELKNGDYEYYQVFNDQDLDYWYRLPFPHEKDDLQGLKCSKQNRTSTEYIFIMNQWEEEKLSSLKSKALNALKETDEAIMELYEKAEEAKKAILAGQEEIKSMLGKVDEKLDEREEKARLRDAQLKSLIIHQTHLIRSNSAPSPDLGKWWPNPKDLAKNFVRRRSQEGEFVVEKLKRKLEEHNLVVIVGMGGIGKTTTTKWFCKRFEEEFQHIIWIDSEGTILTRSLKTLADRLFIPLLMNDGVTPKDTKTIASEIYSQLETAKCLFVFDNAESEGEKEVFAAFKGNHYFLMTSRYRNWDKGLFATFEVGLFSAEEAETFIENNLPPEKLKKAGSTKLLIEKLQFLPLAISQAVACIHQLDLSINEYVDEFDKKADSVLNIDGDGGNTVLKTWAISLEKIQSDQQPEIGDLAVQIIESSAYLHPDHIPKQLFADLSVHKLYLNRAVEVLKQYSLITVQEGSIYIHRLIQETIRSHLNATNKEKDVYRRALSLAVDYFSHNYVHNEDIVHLKSLLAVEDLRRECEILALKADEIIAMVALSNGKVDKAIKMQEEILSHYSKKNASSRETQVAICRLAKSRCEAQQHFDCYNKIEEVCDVMKRKNGEVFSDSIDLDFLVCLEGIHTYHQSMRELLAIKNLDDVIKRQNVHAAFGKDSPKTILSHLAAALANFVTGKDEKGLEILEKVDEMRKEVTSIERDDFVSSSSSSYEESLRSRIRDLWQSLRYFKFESDRTLGPNAALRKQFKRRNEMVRSTYNHIFGHPTDVFGIDFVSLVIDIYDRITGLCDLEKYNESVRMNQCILEFWQNESEDIDVIMEAKNQLGFAYLMSGRIEEARTHFNANANENMPADDGEAIMAQVGLACVYEQTDDITKAKATLLQVTADFALAFGENNVLSRMTANYAKNLDISSGEDDKHDNMMIFEDDFTSLRYAVETSDESRFNQVLNALPKDFDLTAKHHSDSKTILHSICHSGTLPMMRNVLEKIPKNGHSTFVNEPDSKGGTPLILAIFNNRGVPMVKYLLDKSANVSAADLLGWTALHSAVSKENLEVATLLMNMPEVNIRALTKEGNNVIHLAAKSNLKLDVLNETIEKAKGRIFKTEELKAFINERNSKGDTAIGVAVVREKLPFIKRLVEEGGDIANVNNKGWSTLHLAAQKGNREITEYLLTDPRMPKKISSKNSDERTPIHLAASNARLDFVQFLIERGADIESSSSVTLQKAMLNENEDVFLYLLGLINTKYATNEKRRTELIDQKDDEGDTPLMAAVILKKINLLKALIEAGANVKETNFAGRSALHWAAEEGNVEACPLLIKGGLNFSDQDNNGNTPLNAATVNNEAAFVQIVLQQKCDFIATSVNKENETVLHLAVSSHNKTVLEPLLNKVKSLTQGVDQQIKWKNFIDAQDDVGLTALLRAYKIGNEEIKELLLSNGADAYIGGWTDLHLAALANNVDDLRQLTEKSRNNLEAKTALGETPLIISILHSKSQAFSFLLSLNANLTDKGVKSIEKKQRTILHELAKSDDPDMLSATLTKIQDPKTETADIDGNTAFLVSVTVDNPSVTQLLVEKLNCNVKAANKKGNSALHLSAEMGNKRQVKYLIEELKLDKALINKEGKLSADLAKMKGHSQVAAMLSIAETEAKGGESVKDQPKKSEEQQNETPPKRKSKTCSLL